MTSLITRLREAKEGSRELDAEIIELLANQAYADDGEQAAYALFDASSGELEAPPVTTDLSAAVALAERVLPGWHWSIRKKSTEPDFFEGMVTQAAWSYAADRFKVSHDSAPLALCLAILTAKEKANVD